MSEQKSLLIPGDFPPVISGIATYFSEIWKAFPPETHLVLCPKDENWKAFDNAHTYRTIRRRIPNGNSTSSKLLKGILYAFWANILYFHHHYRILHCGQVLSSGFAGWQINMLFHVPYIVYVYGSETFRFGKNPLLRKVMIAFLKKAKWIVPNSRFTMTEFLELGIPENKFRIVTPGVDTQRFFLTEKDVLLVGRYNLSGKFVLLTIARLDERKGHDHIIEAITALKREHPELVYLIVGKGREEARLRALAERLNVSDSVVFCGFVPDDDLPKFYNLSDVFILLNRQTSVDPRLQGDYEGFGIVFLEASACGKPVIAGNYGGIADAVENEKSGFIIDGTDLNMIPCTIEKLIRNQKLRQKLGDYGHQRVTQSFDWKNKSIEVKRLL